MTDDMTIESEKWTRRNLAALWVGQPFTTLEEQKSNMAECDRIMIAFHRFQTSGKVAYRRLLGMHGGGGGTKDEAFRVILNEKVDKDIRDHYQGEFPDNGYWPHPVPNSPVPTLVPSKVEGGDSNPDRCFAYTFCWHAEPEFLLWHRPLVAEFERGLQDHDPKFEDSSTEDRHKGPDALASPYWAWEGWDGLSFPPMLAHPIYVVKTDKWTKQGYPKGFIFPNPYHRWFAPVSIENQKEEYFHTTLSDNNTTTRALPFSDMMAEFSEGSSPWELVSAPKKPSMREVVEVAIHNNNWLEFCTMKSDVGGGSFSIENAHNKFHNHVGGNTQGGIQGPGKQSDPNTNEEFTGTMAQNQSIFDPIFWLHHSNVERQLMSWQRLHAAPNTPNLDPESVPSDELMKRVLYPWTKPANLFRGELSWNTRSTDGPESRDATFRDWWSHTTLPYKYDEYLESSVPMDTNGIMIIPDFPTEPVVSPIRMQVCISLSSYKGGEYELYHVPKSTPGVKELLGNLSILSGVNGVCGRCNKRKEGKIAFEVSDTFSTKADAKNAFAENELQLFRNGGSIKIEKVIVTDWSPHCEVKGYKAITNWLKNRHHEVKRRTG